VSADVVFLDTETTGLEPDRHTIWEVGLITPDGREHVWQFPVDEITADPFALDIGQWWERRWATDNEVDVLNAVYEADNAKSRRKNFPEEGKATKPDHLWCSHFRDLIGTAHICGAIPSFDEERLRRLLLANGVRHRWHYHIIDVEALAAGYICGNWPTDPGWRSLATPPWNSNDLSRAVGVDPDNFERHSALGDARWAKAIYEAVMGS